MSAIDSLLTTVPLDMAGGAHGSGAMGFGFVNPFLGILVLLVIGLIGYLLVRTVRQPAETRAAERTDSALALLRQRYANGEIDEDEFQSRKARLEG